jgi:hypothetical protein
MLSGGKNHGFTPAGYLPCTRPYGRSGPCAHRMKFWLWVWLNIREWWWSVTR